MKRLQAFFARRVLHSGMLIVAGGALFINCNDDPPPADNQPPEVSISQPSNGSTVAVGTVTLVGKVSDAESSDASKLTVIFEYSGDAEGTCAPTVSPAGGVSCSADFSPGAYSLVLKATDGSGASGEATITFSVANGKPTATILTSGLTAATGASVAIEGQVEDPDEESSALAVTWHSDLDGLLSETGANEDGEVSFKSSALSVGTHEITLEVTDAWGASNSDSITVVIEGCADADNDGYSNCDGDCDDSDENVHPNTSDLCDGIDNDCDLSIDEGFDQDDDGYASCAIHGNSPDCNDSNAQVYPGAVDLCDSIDNNCDGEIDEDFDNDEDGVTTCGGDCNDADNTISPDVDESCNGRDDNCDGIVDEGYDLDSDGYSSCGGDCNDQDALTHPGASEVCDGIDNNCDGTVDVDGDSDGYSICQGDCNDSDNLIYPGANEICDTVDNDCDQQIDEDGPTTWYQDNDLDGFGSNISTQACERLEGYSTVTGDCNDSNAAINPAAPEECDTLDNNCDGLIDDVGALWYLDQDQDGFGQSEVSIESCTEIAGYSNRDGDCNDADATINPAAVEICDTLDNNCDGTIDNVATQTWYEDADADSYGNAAASVSACEAPVGYVGVAGDCDDQVAEINPEAIEVCDSIDNDCDSQIDETGISTWYHDADGDSYGDSADTISQCGRPAGYVSLSGDCNDNDDGVYPGADELCDEIDNNCNGLTDENGESQWYADSDNDTYGDPDLSIAACGQPEGYVPDNSDCDDSQVEVHPGADEVCDTLDNDCNGQVDEVGSTWYRDGDSDTYGTLDSTVESCTQPTGYVSRAGDCNDASAAAYPGANEVCDLMDNDCDGTADEEGNSTFFEDLDDDGFGNAAVSVIACYAPTGYVENDDDCNDSQAAVNPAADEVCDTIDNDCDGAVDEDGPSTFYQDQDNDGYGNSESTTVGCSVPSGYSSVGGDCNDSNSSIHPNANEICDSIDNDCDNQTDENAGSTWYRDRDGDGFGATSTTTLSCTQPAGYVATGGDCDDANNAVYPGASEVCDQIDNDCDALTDENVQTTWYQDTDGDGYGTATTTSACIRPSGYAAASGDCNDNNGSINPGATEICDSVDNDCDSSIDEGVLTTWYRDADADGYGVSNSTTAACGRPSGYAAQAGDCNDANAAINPGASEVCDAVDNDCDSQVDEGFVNSTWYRDVDQDGYGSNSSTTQNCTQPSGYVALGGDCNDNNAAIHPGASEVCDQVDNDCDTVTDEGFTYQTWYRDQDQDGYGTNGSTTQNCSQPSGYVGQGGDCNDTNATVYPAAIELCDSIDNDCDGSIDENTSTATWYLDSDADTYGTDTSTTVSCSQPQGYVSRGGDCNDGNAAINPGATEVCDSIDNDCDETLDEGVKSTWYRDLDSDGYGNYADVIESCSKPSGYTSVGGDCDDTEPAAHPDATEVCDSIDNDCDSQVDENLSTATYYRDIDNDGYGTDNSTVVYCSKPSGYASLGGDCNDSDAAVNPGASEVCDNLDNDCDNSTDEGFDNDHDGYKTCTRDCNDANAAVNPAATESCDSIDNDCDGGVDEGLTNTYYPDFDSDSYGENDAAVQACSKPSGYITVAGDCNDDMWSVNPDGIEICNGLDDDCDSLIDALDVFDVTTGNLGSFNSACDSYDRVVGVDVPYLKVLYSVGGISDTLVFRDSMLAMGHTPGARPANSLGWPSGCTYFDAGYYWYDPPDSSTLYSALLCFSKGTDDLGKDEVFIQVTYLGVNIKGVFNNESDSDSSEYDLVDYAAEESSSGLEVWYISDTANASGPGYTATLEILDARAVIDTNN